MNINIHKNWNETRRLGKWKYLLYFGAINCFMLSILFITLEIVYPLIRFGSLPSIQNSYAVCMCITIFLLSFGFTLITWFSNEHYTNNPNHHIYKKPQKSISLFVSIPFGTLLFLYPLVTFFFLLVSGTLDSLENFYTGISQILNTTFYYYTIALFIIISIFLFFITWLILMRLFSKQKESKDWLFPKLFYIPRFYELTERTINIFL